MENKAMVLLCGNLGKRTVNCPIPHQFVSNIQELSTTIEGNPATNFVIIFYGELDSHSEGILKELHQRMHIPIIVTIGNSSDDLPPNQVNRLRLTEDLLTYKTVLWGIRAYQSLSKQYYDSREHFCGKFFEKKAKMLDHWLMENFRLKTSHIMLLPLNTDEDNVRNCQVTLINKCKEKWPKRDIRVCTLDDYILPEEFNFSNEDESTGARASFTRSDRNILLQLIKYLGFIRMYVVGEGSFINNPWSNSLLAKERYITEHSVKQYICGYTFVENFLVSNEAKSDLPRLVKSKWLPDANKITFKSPTDLLADRFFKKAVEKIDDALSNQEIKMEVGLWKKKLSYFEKDRGCSDELQDVYEPRVKSSDEYDSDNESLDALIQP